MSSKQDNWRTPQWLFDWAQRYFGVCTLDAAADDENHLCQNYCTEVINGLTQPWAFTGLTWCNPPYSNIAPWVEKAIKEATQEQAKGSLILLPSRTAPTWFRDVMQQASKITFFVGGRVKFIDPTPDARVNPMEDNFIAYFAPEGALRSMGYGNNNHDFVDIRKIAPPGTYRGGAV